MITGKVITDNMHSFQAQAVLQQENDALNTEETFPVAQVVQIINMEMRVKTATTTTTTTLMKIICSSLNGSFVTSEELLPPSPSLSPSLSPILSPTTHPSR